MRALVGAVALWLVAAVLAALGPVLTFVSGICDEGDCLADSQRLAIGAVPIALTILPLFGAVALVQRRRGAFRPWRALGIASLLTAYALGAGALAWWLASGSDPVIHGDTAWTAFWTAAVACWLALGVALVRA
jgi:hypothetical protein